MSASPASSWFAGRVCQRGKGENFKASNLCMLLSLPVSVKTASGIPSERGVSNLLINSKCSGVPTAFLILSTAFVF